MNDDATKKTSIEEAIYIPAFLNDSASTFMMSTRGVCSCLAEMDDDCGNGEYCSQCSCQGWEHGNCGEGCRQCSNQSSSGGCIECLGEAGDGCLCSGGQGQYPCSQSCTECSKCMDCMDSEGHACNANLQGSQSLYLWDWYANDARSTAYSAVAGNGKTKNFNHTVWNELVDAVYRVRGAADVDPKWSDAFASYSSTKMSSGDKTLTAVRFNSLLHNINTLQDTGISARAPGDIVYGAYFIKMTNILNSYIRGT